LEQLKPVLEAADFTMTNELRKIISDFSLSPAQPTDRSEE